MDHESPPPGWDAAFAAFDRNDVSVEQARRHMSYELPHLRLLELRCDTRPEAVDEARALVGASGSAWLVEAFVAAPMARAARHEEALRARLTLLTDVPRWEGSVARHVLHGIAESALACEHAGRAVDAARRALRFDPLEPRTLETLSRCLAAAGRSEESAAVRAHLWDGGYGPDVIAGTPSAADRAATPWAPDLTDLEPMTLEDRARYAVYSLHDLGAGDSLSAVARQAVALLRCRWVAQAWAHLYALRNWRPSSCELFGWMGVETDDDARDQMRRHLFDAIAATPAGAAAAAAARKKAPNPAGIFEATRLEGVAEAPVEQVAPALLDGSANVRHAACVRIPEHPLAVRASAIERETEGLAPLYGAPRMSLVGYQRRMVGLWTPGWTPGIAPASTEIYKAIYRAQPRLPPAHSFLARARAPRPSCKGCKGTFELGELQLRMRGEFETQDEAKPFHLRCATKPAAKRALAEAVARWRGSVG